MGLISRVSSRTYRLISYRNRTSPSQPNMPKVINERTFIAVKPDGVQRGLVGNIISRFENRGYKLVAIKVCQPGKEHLEKHYADLSSKPFTIRGDFCVDLGRNICHGSDAVNSAEKEIALWFSPAEVQAWESHSKNWIYE